MCYRIPALEDDIVDILKKGISLAAFAIDDPAKIVGVAVLDEKVKGQKEPTVNNRTYPETFKKLEGFFVDLSTVFGSYDIFEALKVCPTYSSLLICAHGPIISHLGTFVKIMVLFNSHNGLF